jgi:Zn-dependent M28 family amino/carboxypeptidase
LPNIAEFEVSTQNPILAIFGSSGDFGNCFDITNLPNYTATKSDSFPGGLWPFVRPFSGCYHKAVITRKALFSRNILILAATLVFAIGAVGLPPALPPVPNTVSSITPEELRMHLQFLASDELGGRYTLSPSFAIAARYLAAHLEADGFRGAGEHGSFLQTFEVVSTKLDPAKTSLELTLNGQTATYSFGEIFATQSPSGGSAQGDIVFVGAGISSASQKHDDYAGLDVKGKIVLVAGGTPAGVDISRVTPAEQGEGAARAHGATGVLQIPQQRFVQFLRDKAAMSRIAGREVVSLARDSEGRLPALTLSPDVADKLLAAAGLNLKDVYQAISKKEPLQPKVLEASARISIGLQQTRQTTQNVAGILEGSDPHLKNEYVIFSAHYDHLKTGPNGEIYHGADDDGSGTSAVLAIAHAMSLDRPKRSVLVMFHAGEELGLLGSEYNTDYAPVVPLDKVVVDLNIDMIGRSKPAGDTQTDDEHLTDANTVYLVGSNRISAELHKLSEETNSQFQKMKLDYYYNDPNNPERIYFRSDHWNYAKHGVPIIFYFDGTHVDYHKPTDTVDKIDFTKMTQITRLVFETGWRIANLDHRLAKDAASGRN